MPDAIITTPLVDSLRAQAARHRENATGLASAALLEEAADEIERERRSFDLRWNADMRAIKRWQDAHPGNDLVWPDHADLCVWLLGEIERITGAGLDAYVSAGRAPELNLSNYGPDDVAEMNAAMVETWSILDTAFGPQAGG